MSELITTDVDHKKVYDEIVRIYDLAEGIVDAIEDEEVKNPEQQVALAEAVVEQAGDSGDELSEIYVDYIEGGNIPKTTDSNRIESAIRKVFSAISDFESSVSEIEPEEKPDSGITIEDLMKKLKIIQILGKDLPESTIQQSLRKHALRLGKKFGGLLVLAIKRLGDHMLGLMHVFQALSLGDVMMAIPNRQGWRLKGTARNPALEVPMLNIRPGRAT